MGDRVVNIKVCKVCPLSWREPTYPYSESMGKELCFCCAVNSYRLYVTSDCPLPENCVMPVEHKD